jgi:hypothetical protein
MFDAYARDFAKIIRFDPQAEIEHTLNLLDFDKYGVSLKEKLEAHGRYDLKLKRENERLKAKIADLQKAPA